MDNIIVEMNEKQQRFEVHADDEIAYLQYRFYKGDIALMHTFVPGKLGGKGIATALAKYALDHAKENNLRVMVYCPFVAGFLKKNPEYNVLVDRQYTEGGK